MPAPSSDISNAELAMFCRQFGSLIHADVNILQVMEALRNQVGKAYFREIIDQVRRDVEMGRTLATAFSRYPQTFSPFFISMIRQGELEGELDSVLLTLADHFESRLDRDVNAARTRTTGGALDLETLISVVRYGMVWMGAFLSAIFVAAGIILYAASADLLPREWQAASICLITGLFLFLGVLLFSRQAR
ncbi:MAG: type II secretion system F family protein [Armatimonadota bacterium]